MNYLDPSANPDLVQKGFTQFQHQHFIVTLRDRLNPDGPIVVMTYPEAWGTSVPYIPLGILCLRGSIFYSLSLLIGDYPGIERSCSPPGSVISHNSVFGGLLHYRSFYLKKITFVPGAPHFPLLSSTLR